MSREPDPSRQLSLGRHKRSVLWWLAWLPLVIVIVAGCWLRWRIAASEMLWLDELHTGWTVKAGFGEMLSRSAQGNQAPLFFGLVWNVVAAWGTSELTLRLVSVVSGSLLMLVAAWCVWRWTHSCFSATVVAGLIAIDDSFIWFATEARPYALVHLLSVLQMGAFLVFLDQRHFVGAGNEAEGKQGSGKLPWAFVLLSLCLLYTHYTSMFLLVSELVFLLIAVTVDRFSGSPVRTAFGLKVGWAAVAIAIGSSPLLLQMGQAFGQPSDWELVASTTQFVDEQGMNLLAWFLLPISSVVAVWLFSQPSGGIARRATATGRSVGGGQSVIQQRIWAMATIYFLPCAMFFLLEKAGVLPITLSRYLAPSVVAGPMFAAILLGTVTKGQLRFVGLIFLTATMSLQWYAGRFVAQTVSQRQIPQMRVEDWPAAITKINTTSSKDSHPVFLFGAVIEDAGALRNQNSQFQQYLQFPIDSVYALKQNSRFVFAGPTVSVPHFDDAAVDKVIKSGGAWVLIRHHRSHAISIVRELIERIHDRRNGVEEMPSVMEFSRDGQIIHLISIDCK